MESLDPPPKSRMAKWRLFGLRAASSLIWGDGPLFFDGGERESGKFSHANIFFYIYMDAASAANDFCVCVSVSSCNPFFFSCTFSVFTASANNLFQTPPPLSKK